MSELIVASSPEALAALAAEWLHREVTRAIEARGRCSLCLAGGRTPAAAYRKLAAVPLEWDKVEVFFGDERAVPSDDPESNYRMVRETLLARVPIPPAQVHRMLGERADRAAAAAAYERTLPPRLDLLVLGIGSDGHTASLFPGSPALGESRLVVPAVGPRPPAARLTITPPVIAAARQVAVLATGAEKAEMVRLALEGPWAPDRVPAQLARRGTWFLDQPAAARLTSQATAP